MLTQENRKALPALYATEGTPLADKIVHVKFFQPWGLWTWYALEFDGDDRFFGYVDGFEREAGDFSLMELCSLRGPLGLKIERDLYWTPRPLGDVFPDLRVDKTSKA